jgi:SAM-dependent methyltransferase
VSTEFSRQQFDLAYPEGIDGHFWTLARHALVERLVRGGGDPGLVLDVGCGLGLTVDFLRGRGLDCHGVELSSPPVPERLRASVFTGRSAFDLPEEFRRRVQVILLLDVIEHLPDAEEFLRTCRRSFPGLRRLVVTVPARPELWSNYDDFYGHHRRYVPATLAAHLAAAAPARVATGYFFHLLYPLLRGIKATGRVRQISHRKPRWKGFHGALGHLFDLEQRVLPGSWPGSSLWGRAEIAG